MLALLASSFTNLDVQLAGNIPQIQRLISDTDIGQNDVVNHSPRDQWCQLVLRPLSRLDSNSCPSSYALVGDALDECDKKEHIRMILQLLAEARKLKMVRLRVFLTSRPKILIQYSICQIPDAEHQNFVLHNVSSSIINHYIGISVQHNLNSIACERSLVAAGLAR
jgi:hypothetical protein